MARQAGIAAAMAAIAFSFWSTVAIAQDDPASIFRSLHPRNGVVEIANGIVRLNIGPDFTYLASSEATTVLTKVFHNPPEAVADNLGMILPRKQGETWFAVLSYSSDGHVSDSDAQSVNYDDLLKQMQDQTETDAKTRRDQGFSGLKLLGWAQRPYYDSTAKKIYWAKSIQFDNMPSPTLNYDVRILGRSGYLNMKIVDSMEDLPKINAEIPQILSMADFTTSNRYSDYVAGSDHLAAYGIAGLVAGGVLAKAGFFKGLLVLLAAFWKVVGAAVIAVFAALGSFFKRIFKRSPAQ